MHRREDAPLVLDDLAEAVQHRGAARVPRLRLGGQRLLLPHRPIRQRQQLRQHMKPDGKPFGIVKNKLFGAPPPLHCTCMLCQA